MTAQTIPAGTTNTCIKYMGGEYICLGSNAPGSVFKLYDGTDVSSDVSDINQSSFTVSVVAVCDILTTIVDERANVYFPVLYYTITQQIRPTRA